MKTKRFDKKLTLGKQTIAHMNGKELDRVRAGKVTVLIPCETVKIEYCMTTYHAQSCPGTICA